MKKTINKTAFVSKPIAAAVGLAMGALVAANTAAAAAADVQLSPNGLGSALMFPYYTVNNGYDTNINITNTSNKTVAFKIRFRESENSRDARDFNVVLSPYDVWNGSVTKNEDGGARLVTRDTSCTVGQLNELEGTNARYIDFTDFDYTDQTVEYGVDNSDTGSTGLARTTEGHIEVIAMGQLINEFDSKVNDYTTPAAALQALADAEAGKETAAVIAWAAKHVNSTPNSCDVVRAAFAGGEETNEGFEVIEKTRSAFEAADDVLKGSISFVNAVAGKAITSEPTVLANFFTAQASEDNLIVLPGSQAPGLHDANGGLLAVNELIARKAIANQYSVNPNALAQTDWVVTFPTKHYHVDERDPFAKEFSTVNDGDYYKGSQRIQALLTAGDASGDVWAVKPATSTAAGVAMPPFRQTFQSGTAACAPVGVSPRFFDREENEFKPQTEVGFSPAKPVEAQSICKEVQVITFNNTNLFGASGSENINVSAAGFNNGWMQLNFRDFKATDEQDLRFGETSDVMTAANKGFPVIGFSATTLENGSAGEFILNYGFSSNHAYPKVD